MIAPLPRLLLFPSVAIDPPPNRWLKTGAIRSLVLAGLVALFLAGGRITFADPPATRSDQPSPTRQRDQRPNILFCVADDWSYGHASAYGCGWVATPGFDRIAREGLLFTRCYTPNAKCAPSRSCLLTGRNSWQLEAAANHWCQFPTKFRTYPEALRDAGYSIGVTGKGWGPGIALTADGKRRDLVGPAFNSRRQPPPTPQISNNDYAGNFEAFLEASDADRPWCFWVGSTEPHRGYEFGSGVAKGGKALTDIDRVPGYWPDNETIRHDMLDYAFEVEHFDQHVVRILETLDRRGLAADTIVVFTSDHGMPFPRVKGQAYDDSHRVPLAIRWEAGIAHAGRTIDDLISFVDFAPTWLEVAEIDWPDSGMEPSPGRSLTEYFGTDATGTVMPERDHVLIGKERHDIGRPGDVGYPIRGIVTATTLYLQNYEPDRWPAGNPETGYPNVDGSPTKTWLIEARRTPETRSLWALNLGKRPAEELYDLASDPDCLVNLAVQLDAQATKSELRQRMERELANQDDPRMKGQGAIFDTYPYAGQDRGYYEEFRAGRRSVGGWINPSDVDAFVEPVPE